MASIRYGSAATGKVVWTVPKVIQSTTFTATPHPPPPPPEPTVQEPKVNVTRFDGMIKVGWRCHFNDGNGTRWELWVDEHKSLRIHVENSAGSDTTGKVRQILP